MEPKSPLEVQASSTTFDNSSLLAAGVQDDGLAAAIGELLPMAIGAGPAADPALVGMLIAVAALRRRESRGSHFRNDFPTPRGAFSQRHTLTQQTAIQDAPAIAQNMRLAALRARFLTV